MYPKHRARNFRMILTHWSPDYLDPHSNADAFASNPDNSDEAKLTGVIAWRGAWDTPENTALVAQARQELDAEKRKELYLQIQKNVQEDLPFVFMFQNVVAERSALERRGLHLGPELRPGILSRRRQELSGRARALPAGLAAESSSSAFASRRSGMSKRSVNQL